MSLQSIPSRKSSVLRSSLPPADSNQKDPKFYPITSFLPTTHPKVQDLNLNQKNQSKRRQLNKVTTSAISDLAWAQSLTTAFCKL